MKLSGNPINFQMEKPKLQQINTATQRLCQLTRPYSQIKIPM